MSIIAALVSPRHGVVASDGRIFAPAAFNGDSVVRPAVVHTENFDKTFSLDGGKLIGACAGGVMCIAGRSVPDHVAEIHSQWKPSKPDLAAWSEYLGGEIALRLQHIPPEEVLFSHRQLDILMVSGKNLSRKKMRIVSLAFQPDNGQIVVTPHTFDDAKRNVFVVRGDAMACRAANQVLKAGPSSGKASAAVVTRAIEAGLRDAGTHPHGSERSCGGQIFNRET